MANLFRRAAVCTDIHFGLKSNSQTHNDDCLNFIKWFTAKAKLLPIAGADLPVPTSGNLPTPWAFTEAL